MIEIPRCDEWFAARVISGKEKIIELYMKREQIRVYFPETQGKRLFPGYAFFQFCRENDWWYSINNTHGVVHLLPIKNERPIPIKSGIIDGLIAKIDAGGFTPKQAQDLILSYLPGQTVPVVDGTHAGCEGELIRSTKNSLILLMVMFNRKVEVAVPKHCIAA